MKLLCPLWNISYLNCRAWNYFIGFESNHTTNFRYEALLSAMNHIINQTTVYEAILSTVNHTIHHTAVYEAIVSCVSRYHTPYYSIWSYRISYESYHTPNFSVWSYCVLCQSCSRPNYNAGCYYIPCNSYRTQTAGCDVTVSPVNCIVHYNTIYGMKFCVHCLSHRTPNYSVLSYSIHGESYYTQTHSA